MEPAASASHPAHPSARLSALLGQLSRGHPRWRAGGYPSDARRHAQASIRHSHVRPGASPRRYQGTFPGSQDPLHSIGEVREADVFIGRRFLRLPRQASAQRLSSVLRREIAAFRAAAYQRALDELTSANFARLVVQLNDWIESRNLLKADRPIDALLVERAAEDFAVLPHQSAPCEALEAGAKARCGTLDDWHRTRIAAKKLRYAGEPLFQALAPKIDTDRLSKQLSRLQTSLGRLNDLQTITPFLARVRPYVQGRSRRNFEAVEHFCRGWSGAAAASLVDRAEEAMRGFEKIQLDASGMTKHVCVINWKGGCGKTTIATHLAVALAASGLETDWPTMTGKRPPSSGRSCGRRMRSPCRSSTGGRISAGVPSLFSASLSIARRP